MCCTDAGSIGALSDLRDGESDLGGFISGGWRESDVTEGFSEAEDFVSSRLWALHHCKKDALPFDEADG